MPKSMDTQVKQLWQRAVASWGNGNDFSEAIDDLMQFAMYNRGRVTMAVWLGDELLEEDQIIVARSNSLRDDPPTLDLNLLQQMERGMFAAYCREVDNKNYQGKEIPMWDGLPPQIQRAWRAAMFYVMEEMNKANNNGQ